MFYAGFMKKQTKIISIVLVKRKHFMVGGLLWTCLDLSGLVWTCLDLSGLVWICLVLSSKLVWTCLDLSGLVWTDLDMIRLVYQHKKTMSN